jgi:hypothetical protein
MEKINSIKLIWLACYLMKIKDSETKAAARTGRKYSNYTTTQNYITWNIQAHFCATTFGNAIIV